MAELTADERARLAEEIRNQQRELNAKLQAIGIDLSDKPRQMKSPDGGPTSTAHDFLRPVMRRTMDVYVDSANGGRRRISIAVENYNPGLHTLAEEEEGGGAAEEPTSTPRARRRRELRVDDSEAVLEPASSSRDELMALTIPALLELPEVEMLEDVPTDKAQLVDAIWEVRQGN